MSDEFNQSPQPVENTERSVLKTLGNLFKEIFWVVWDWFWEQFDLQSVGEEMKEHSALMKRRAKVVVVLFIFLILGAIAAWQIQGCRISKMSEELISKDKTCQELRGFLAGKPTALTPAQLMGFHDETNYVVSTNMVFSTNFVMTSVTVISTNKLTFYASNPILDFYQMEDLKSRIGTTTNYLVTIFCNKNDAQIMDLAKQVYQVFGVSGFGFKNGGISITEVAPPAGNIMISSVYPVPPQIKDAILTLGVYLGKGVTSDKEESSVMATNELWIFLSTK